jgi:2-oxoisovalerate dehydrogenase E2 component (dihydrolipoyl transacylase)
MPFTLTMPEVGETVTEGTIERWLKKPGEQVNKYEPIVEINTDKVDVELPSPVTGTVIEILAAEGTVVLVGGPLATIETVAGETPADVLLPKPVEEQLPTEQGVVGKKEAARTRAATATTSDSAAGQRRATPRVRRLAEELGVDLAQIAGSGPGGRIVEEDIREAKGKATPAKAASPAVPGEDEESIPLTGIRRTIAQRMSASAFSAPHAWLAVEADVTGLVALRASLKEKFREREGFDLTYLPFMAQAVSQALLEHPYLNASWAEDHIILRKRINLGIAVATERGLLVPVVHDADRLSVAGLAQAMHDLGERSRENKLKLEDVQGGTFTLDNTGAFGSMMSMPIINLGQAAIISLEMITTRPVVVGDNAIAVRSVVTLCLSFDHRILDGHQAGAFLGDVKRRLEAFGPESGID